MPLQEPTPASAASWTSICVLKVGAERENAGRKIVVCIRHPGAKKMKVREVNLNHNGSYHVK